LLILAHVAAAATPCPFVTQSDPKSQIYPTLCPDVIRILCPAFSFGGQFCEHLPHALVHPWFATNTSSGPSLPMWYSFLCRGLQKILSRIFLPGHPALASAISHSPLAYQLLTKTDVTLHGCSVTWLHTIFTQSGAIGDSGSAWLQCEGAA